MSEDSQSPTGRRRSSGAKFANLMQQKRNPEDTEGAARRASINEQYAGQPGMLGKMWNNFTRGHDSSTTTTSTTSTDMNANAGPQKTGSVSDAIPKQSIHRTGAGTLG